MGRRCIKLLTICGSPKNFWATPLLLLRRCMRRGSRLERPRLSPGLDFLPDRCNNRVMAGPRTVAIALACLLAACSSSTSSGSGGGGSSDKYGAFDVCTQFVKQRLKAPGGATFRDPLANNGDTTFTAGADSSTWTIASSVDSQNGFGAKLRSTFTCTVHHVSGAQWSLQALNVVDGGA